MTNNCCDDYKKLVRWSIVFDSPGSEDRFSEPEVHEELISSGMTQSEFETWKVAEFFQRHPRIPPSYGRYVRVYSEVLRCYEKPERDFEQDQIRVLEEIRNAIRGKDHRHRVRLPKTLRLAGPLLPEKGKSEFGDEFINMPEFLGASAAPGHTILSGWVEVIFSQPQGDTAELTLSWFAVGTPVVITFGGGQQFVFERTRTFPLPYLPDLTPVQTKGKLDLVTGKVRDLQIFATFQGTTIARTDKVNRIPYAFPYIFPPLPPPPGFQPPPGYQPPNPMPNVFGQLEFSYDFEGNITGLELHSETFAPVGLFPYLPGLFPPYSFGPKGQFHFANPDRCLVGTPPQDCPNDKEKPDGILTSVSVYFHPHLDLVSQEMSEVPAVEAAPACLPEPAADAAVVAVDGRLYHIGGIDGNGGVTGRVQVYDAAAHQWQPGPPLPRPVSLPQAAVVGNRIYVLGGWTEPDKTPTGAVQVLEAGAKKWRTDVPDLPVPVAGGTAAAMGDKIYVISGWAAGLNSPAISSKVQILDTRDRTWKEGASASLPAVGASAVALDDEILVIGGRIAGDKVTHRTAVYNVKTNLWAIGPDTLQGVYQAAAGYLEGRVYLVGGRDKVDGPALPIVQELDVAKDAWRPGLPQPLPAVASGAAVLDGSLYVAGGRSTTGVDQLGLSQVVQRLEPSRGWQTCGDLPVFTAASVFNAAALGVGPTPRVFSPGTLAVLAGQNLAGPDPGFVEITVGGRPAAIVGMVPVPIEAVWFQIPPDVDPAPGVAELRLVRKGAKQQAPPVYLPMAAASPGIFVYNFGELLEPTYLENNGALACNQDQTLNYASQPARPGQILVLWATGLGQKPDKDKLTAQIGGKDAKVENITPAPPLPPPFPPLLGVYLVHVRLPEKIQSASFLPAVLRYEKTTSNRAGVAVWRENEVPPPPQPVPCAYPPALGAVFPFLVPPPGK